jgi:hypothetical protein
MKMIVSWDVVPCSLVDVYRSVLALRKKAAGTPETAINFCQNTRLNIPDDSPR